MVNSVCHFEIPADDLERAGKFYRIAFGWTFEAWGPPDFFVVGTGNTDDPGIVEGALVKRRGAVGEGINGYRCTITVASIEDSIERITKAGGEMTSEIFPIPGIGRVASFLDTEGNAVAVVEYVEGDARAVR